jgi:MFS transporter, DHA3 family, macrolide efflux protein
MGGSLDPSNPGAPRLARLWTRNFLLIWQGQVVSALGDVVYEIALGFWILAVTGSTALMGGLMAASTLPRIVVGPFAGVLVDRMNRKWLLLLTDIVRGVVVVAVGLAAFAGVLRVWMVFAAGIVIGLGGACFSPGLSAVVPDIVEPSRLVQANSAMSLIGTGAGVLGSSAGGFLYAALGAPLLFLVNGISYIFSALMFLGTRIPRTVRRMERTPFFTEMKAGFALVWKMRGLRALFLLSSVLNFFAVMGFMLILPLFQQNPELGPKCYGLAIGAATAGMTAGFLLAATLRIPPARRFLIFLACGFALCAAFGGFPLVRSFPLMAVMLFAGGLLNAILNSLIPATIQLAVPADMRGKVFALLGSFTQGLTPISMALGGVAAQVWTPKAVVVAAFIVTFLCFIPALFMPPLRRFVEFDPEKQEVGVLY